MSTNGNVNAAELVAVQGRIRLSTGAAAAWSRLVSAVSSEARVALRITAPYGGYRSIADQWEMWNDRSTSTNGKVAYPGSSVHGFGNAVDISNWGSVGTARLDEIAKRYGFIRNIKGEPWHYQYQGGSSGGGSAVPEPATRKYFINGQEQEMIAVILNDGRNLLGGGLRTYIVGSGTFVETTGQENANLISVLVNRYFVDDSGKPSVAPSPNLTYEELYRWAKAGGLSASELAPYARAAGR